MNTENTGERPQPSDAAMAAADKLQGHWNVAAKNIATCLEDGSMSEALIAEYISDYVRQPTMRIFDEALAPLREELAAERREREDAWSALHEISGGASGLTLKEGIDSEFSTLRASNDKLRAALEWYQANVSDCRKLTDEGDSARRNLDKDGGAIATAALSPEKKE